MGDFAFTVCSPFLAALQALMDAYASFGADRALADINWFVCLYYCLQVYAYIHMYKNNLSNLTSEKKRKSHSSSKCAVNCVSITRIIN